MIERSGAGTVAAFAPGRVVLIGDHTDYAGGLSLTMAIDLGTTTAGQAGGDLLALRSDAEAGTVFVPTGDLKKPTAGPSWGAYAWGVAAAIGLRQGFRGSVTTTLAIGAGLSSSASLELSLALALGFDGTPAELAELGQRAEHLAVGVPCGPMDQMTIAHGRRGHALLLDFTAAGFEHVSFPQDLDVVVVHSGQSRTLDTSAYAERRAQCKAAAALIGPLTKVSDAEIAALSDPILRQRARHVRSESERVTAFAETLAAGRTESLGVLMTESHRSLRDDFQVSTPALDGLVAEISSRPGVLGARLTGAGFGGCVVALAERGAIADPTSLSGRGWLVRPSDGARIVEQEGWDDPEPRS